MRILRRSGARYPLVNGVASVELKLRSPRLLFDERDPAPVRQRDLDDEAAKYILTSFREIEDQRNVKLALYFETLEDFRESRDISEAVQAHFAFQAEVKRRELKEIFSQGALSLAIGLIFLFICSYIGHGGASKPTDLLGSMRYEGFFILAWVSMWRPFSAFLYEWWPIRESMVMYRRLSTIEIEIVPREEAARRIEESRAASVKADAWRELNVATTTTA